jgi:hypothetical protein
MELAVGLNSEMSKVKELFEYTCVSLTDNERTRPEGLTAMHEVAKAHWLSGPTPDATVVTCVVVVVETDVTVR